MATFKEYINEVKLPTVKQIQKMLAGIKFDMILPDFFQVEKKNTDAGMGGYDYIQITFDKDLAMSTKRAKDVRLGLMALGKYKADTSKATDGLVIIR